MLLCGQNILLEKKRLFLQEKRWKENDITIKI